MRVADLVAAAESDDDDDDVDGDDGCDANDDAADADDDDDNANDRRDCDDTVCEAFTRITTRRLKHRYIDTRNHGGSRKQLGLRIGGCQLGV